LILTGGEPTLHPNLSYIVKNSKIQMKLWSNLRQESDYYIRLKESNDKLLELYTSYHPGWTKYNKWKEKITELSKYFHIRCNIMFSNEHDNLINEQLDELNSIDNCLAHRGYIVGIKDYYKDILVDISYSNNFINEHFCNINDKPYYFFDRKNLNFKTIAVNCDMNHHRLELVLDDIWYACKQIYKSLKNDIESKIICKNNICTAMYLRRGNKKGLFQYIEDGIEK